MNEYAYIIACALIGCLVGWLTDMIWLGFLVAIGLMTFLEEA
jgi:uncharacterized membrane protein YfcA